LLRKVQVIPADDRVFDQSPTALRNLLLFFFTINELLVVTERDGFRELLRTFNLVQLFFNSLPELWVINVPEDEVCLDDFAKLFQSTVQWVLF
jgi:hypothetical protein